MKTCQRCHEERPKLKARGLCKTCYNVICRAQQLHLYATKRAPNTPSLRCECGRRLYRQAQKDAGVCSECAGTSHAQAIRAEELIEDAEWLAATGEILENAAARVGMRVDTFERALHRYGRHDLYRRLLRNGAAA
jgi:excinuclease UvrABC ATPase subunit